MASLPGNWLAYAGELIACNTVSAPGTTADRSNRALIELLGGWLAQRGLDCHIQPLDDSADGKANLYARIGPDGGGGLILCGHADTVPAQAQEWHGDPWRLRVDENSATGLGIADMKGFFASALCALEALDLGALRRPLAILATADEESDMQGARRLERERLRDYACAVVGEPTGLRPVNAHKGVLMERIALAGKAAHSSRPADGRNAILAMNRVINGLQGWQGELRESFAGQARLASFDVAWPTINLGRIAGGDIANRVAPDCSLDIDFRLVPGQDLDAVRAEIRRRAMQAVDGLGVEISFDEIFKGIEPMHTDAEAPLLGALARLCQSEPGGVSFATEAPFLQATIPEVAVLGPGRIEAAHQPNESIGLDAVARFDGILRGLIDELCLKP